jgi:hypothetical protein
LISMSEKVKAAAQEYVTADRDMRYMNEDAAGPYPGVVESDALESVLTTRWPLLVEEAKEKAAKRTVTALNKLITAVLEDYGKQPEVPPVEEPPQAPSKVGPLGIFYKNTTNIGEYYRSDAIIVAGRTPLSHSTRSDMQEARRKGAKVLQYIVPTERPDNPVSALDNLYYGDLSKVPLWPYASRVTWEGTKATDIRPGSDWIKHTVEFISNLMRSKMCDGVFLDTVGARPWNKLAEWDKWPTEEKNMYTLGCVDLMRRLDAARTAINKDFLLVPNNLWDRGDGNQAGYEGELYSDALVLEHHLATSAYHRNYASRTLRPGRMKYGLIISNTEEDAAAWAKVPGVTHVCAQRTYEYPAKVVV